MTLPATVAAQVKPLKADDIFPGLQKQVAVLQSRPGAGFHRVSGVGFAHVSMLQDVGVRS